jgi:hypothetical protein
MPSAGPMKVPEDEALIGPTECTKVRAPLGCTDTMLELEPIQIEVNE